MKALVARVVLVLVVLGVLFVGALRIVRSSQADQGGGGAPFDTSVERDLRDAVREGRNTFRFDTFGDEDFWGGTLQLHRAIEGARFGGVGPGVSPATALAVGLKVDVDLHTATEIGVDDFQSSRAPDRRYRTAPLKGLWTHEKGGFYHDGRFATLRDVVVHYNGVFNLGLVEDEIQDVVQFLRSI